MPHWIRQATETVIIPLQKHECSLSIVIVVIVVILGNIGKMDKRGIHGCIKIQWQEAHAHIICIRFFPLRLARVILLLWLSMLSSVLKHFFFAYSGMARMAMKNNRMLKTISFNCKYTCERQRFSLSLSLHLSYCWLQYFLSFSN